MRSRFEIGGIFGSARAQSMPQACKCVRRSGRRPSRPWHGEWRLPGEGRRSLVAARRKQAIAKTTRQASPPTDHPKLRRIDPSKEPRASAREVHRQTIAPPKTQYWPRPHRPADRTTFGSVDPYPRPAAGGFSNGQVDSDRPPGPTARPKPGSALPRNILVTPQGGTGAISPPPASRSSDSRAVAQNPMKQFSEKPNYSSISALITSW
jgi:hypothetical protein